MRWVWLKLGLVNLYHQVDFQSPQKFIEAGGYKGTQDEYLKGDNWTLNPWFVEIEQEEMIEIRASEYPYPLIKDLVFKVLKPIMLKCFQIAAKNYESNKSLSFQTDIQHEAADLIKHEFNQKGIESILTLIIDINSPDDGLD
jgi:uncharacterized membrane protein YqiK